MKQKLEGLTAAISERIRLHFALCDIATNIICRNFKIPNSLKADLRGQLIDIILAADDTTQQALCRHIPKIADIINFEAGLGILRQIGHNHGDRLSEKTRKRYPRPPHALPPPFDP